MHGRALILFATLAGLAVACESSTDVKVQYAASLSGTNEVPSLPAVTGTGAFQANVSGTTLTYTLTFSGLTSNANAAHIHGPGTATQAVGVLVDFDAASLGRTITLGAASGTASGTIDISPAAIITATVNGDSLRKLLDLGLLYVNVHTVNNGGGEIRGQIAKQ